MAKSGVYDWSRTVASNSDIAGIDITGLTGKVSQGDDAIRTIMKQGADFATDLGGAATTAGTNTVTVTLNQTVTAYVTGMHFRVLLGGTNTGAATLNVNGLGAKNIKVYDAAAASVDPAAGALLIGNYALFTYDGTNMVLLNPAPTKATDIASATTTVLNPANGSVVDITGTTTVTAVTLREGGRVFARATGAFQITAGASLVVNGSTSVNFTTQAQDLLLFEGFASSVVRVWLIGGPSDVNLASTQTLTNKTLSGNTAVNLISGAGTLTLNTTGNATVPNATDTLVGKATTDTLTNKTTTGMAITDYLRFAATQVPSAGVNDLDDYEEGTWTPAFSSTGATFNYTSQQGTYVKVGQEVYCSWAIQLAGSGNTLTGNPLSVTGLPFTTAASFNQLGAIVWQSAAGNFVNVQTLTNASATTLLVYGLAAAGATMGQLNSNALLANSSLIIGTFTYRASA